MPLNFQQTSLSLSRLKEIITSTLARAIIFPPHCRKAVKQQITLVVCSGAAS